jgi:opacity protein-like surface antigen
MVAYIIQQVYGVLTMYKVVSGRFFSFILIAIALGISAGQVLAKSNDIRFYLGGELSYNKYSYAKGFKDHLNNNNISVKSEVPGASIIAGARHGENFGTEVGYEFLRQAKSSSSNGSIKAKNAYLDLLGYIPVDNQVELIGTFGVGRMRLKEEDYVNTNSKNQTKTNLRTGVGAQYTIGSNLLTRIMVRYQKVGSKPKDSDFGIIKNKTSLNLGMTYLF